MGKSSTSCHSFKEHQQLSSHSRPSSLKSNKRKRKKKNKTKAKIKKLFDHLRNQSVSTSTSNDTIIELDDTVVEMPLNNNCKENNENLIVIKDDEEININNEQSISHGPLHFSTPLSHNSKILQDISTDTSPRININDTSQFNEEVVNLTKEINRDSYLTIDLTTDSGVNKTNPSDDDNVIDLVNTSDDKDIARCSSLSMSGDSDVTVINTVKQRKKDVRKKQMNKFANGIAQLDSSERGKLLELIAQKIFNGCNSPSINSLHSLKNGVNRSTETVEDTYIKQVILGQTQSRNSIGSNIYNPEKDVKNKTGLRMIVIDGSNVAMQHTKGRIFSVKGLKICIDYFLQRGHTVKAFVPHFRCKYGKSTDGKLLDQMERQGHVVYTPSREVQGRMINSYDDRYIVQCAAEFDGVIVSGDNYRDLMRENPRWKYIIENRLLPFTWVGDMIMFPRDPLGRNGPTLQNFLRHNS